MEARSDFTSFIWKIISSLADTILSIVEFCKDLITFIPNFLDFLPSEIKVIFLPCIAIIVFIFIYRFIK